MKQVIDFNKMKMKAEIPKEISDLDLKQRKEKLKEELKHHKQSPDELKKLLLLDNINETLICKYLLSLNKKSAEIIIPKYSMFIRPDELLKIVNKIFGKGIVFGQRTKSFKKIFFEPLLALSSHNKDKFEEKIALMKTSVSPGLINNQPFNTENLEAFYYYICFLFCKQIKDNENKRDKYLENLEEFLLILQDLQMYSKEDNFEKEKEDINKFLIFCFSIVNLDTKNIAEISQVAYVLNDPGEEMMKQIIKTFEIKLKTLPIKKDKKEQIRKSLIIKDVNILLTYKMIDDEVIIPEECFRYDYIMKNNIYKKYQEKIKQLLSIIFTSRLMIQLFDSLFNEENRKMKYFFSEEDSIDELWNNMILFVPFRLTGISGFSYRDIFKIFISIYMICHFNSLVENEIFTLGAFVRVIIHETMGHFFISYRFFMFFTNIIGSDEKKESPRMKEQLKKINIKVYVDSVGKKLAEISLEIIEDPNINNLEKEKKLKIELEKIIGSEYSNIVSKKLIENIENENEQKKSIPQESNNIESEKEKKILKLSKEIIEILFTSMSNEFDSYLSDLDKIYKEQESGNVAEFLLFNDFSQNMTLKQCMFLLNEENYKDTNLFEFRTKFKACKTTKNEDFLKNMNKKDSIFSELISKYKSIYNKVDYIKNNFTSPKTFRGNFGDNLNREMEFFTCHFVGHHELELLEETNQD